MNKEIDEEKRPYQKIHRDILEYERILHQIQHSNTEAHIKKRKKIYSIISDLEVKIRYGV